MIIIPKLKKCDDELIQKLENSTTSLIMVMTKSRKSEESSDYAAKNQNHIVSSWSISLLPEIEMGFSVIERLATYGQNRILKNSRKYMHPLSIKNAMIAVQGWLFDHVLVL